MPLQKQLGEPYRSQWIAMNGGAESGGAAQPTNRKTDGGAPPVLKRQNRFVSSEEEVEYNLNKKKAVQSSIQKRENKKAANKEFVVDMTRKVRRSVEGEIESMRACSS